MSIHDTLATLIDGGRILQAEGHADLTRGHISVRDPEDPARFHMKPHSLGLDEMTEDNLVLCDRDGARLGGGRRHSEVFIHSEIFKARPDVMSVIHSHSPYAVAFSSTGQAMEALSQPSSIFVDALPAFSGTIDLIRNPDQGRDVAAALGPHRAVLLRGHGVAIAGASIEEAVIVAIMLENACMIHLAAKAAGAAAPPYARADVEALKSKLVEPEQFRVNFAYLRRKHGRAGAPASR